MAARKHQYRGIPILYDRTRDGWHSLPTVGHKPNGDLDRRHVRGKTVEDVKAALKTLLDSVATGNTPKVGRSPTVQEWIGHWLSEIAPFGRKPLAPKTIESYLSLCRNWIYPNVGRIRLDALEAESVDAMLATMRRGGVGNASTSKAFAILRRALNVAVRRGKILRNPCLMMEPPETPRPRRTPLSTAVAERFVQAVLERRSAARWLVGLNIGPRQGETLGLTWDLLDLDAGTVEIAWQLQRLTWQHGCATACGQRAAKCPQRHSGGLVLRRPKAWRPDNPPRVVGLSERIVELLRDHRKAQRLERIAAGTAWRQMPHPDGGVADFVFRQIDGAPIDPRADWGELQSILDAAGLPRTRVHTMRHTAATMLVDLGVDIAVIQEILGHTQIQTTRRYATVRTQVTKSAADKLGDVLLGTVTPIDTQRSRRRSS